MRARLCIRLTKDANTRSPPSLLLELSQVKIASFTINHKKLHILRGHLDYHIWYACSSLRPLSIQYLYADLAVKIQCLFHLQITSSHSLPPGGHFCIRLLSYRAYVWAIASACALISKSHLFRCHKRPMDTFLLVASSKTFILRYRQLAVKILSITDILSY